MLRLDLTRLAREGSVLVEASVPREDALWEGTDLRFSQDVRVRLRATYAGSGELVVRGEFSARLDGECRRCLEPVASALVEELTMVFAEEQRAEVDSGESRPYDPGAMDLDLGSAVREELLLAVDPYVVCREECAGLCGRCGANLNEETCACGGTEPDPRWEALRALQEE